jgi:hypothetical protein
MRVDVMVYCATPAGLLSAFAIRQSGLSVLIVEPSRSVGGILGAGLKPTQDMPNYDAVGGKTRALMVELGVNRSLDIRKDSPVIDQIKQKLASISPRHIRESFLGLSSKYDLPIIFSHRISETKKSGRLINSASFDRASYDVFNVPPSTPDVRGSLRVEAKIFIDASYDGELMARSGVSYRVGRDSRLDYGEDTAGVLPIRGGQASTAASDRSFGNNHSTSISPFIEAGNPASGLLPLVEEDHRKSTGAGDHYVQAANFRISLTTDPARRVTITAPQSYRPADYEMIGRYIEHLKSVSSDIADLQKLLTRIFPGAIQGGVYNYDRRSLFSVAPLGVSHLLSVGDYATKSRIWKEHQDYLTGLHHFMSTDRRVPESFRAQTSLLGLDAWHYPESSGWPHQLYIREGRRMVGRYTITLHDVYNETDVSDSIGLAQYGIDTYPVRRIFGERDGSPYVAIEGNMFVGGSNGPTRTPYAVPYRAITPQKHECENLLVPVSFSASHLGYASARMEPTFMILGESAGVAAVHAVREGVAVQDVDPKRLAAELIKRGQRLRPLPAQKRDWKVAAGVGVGLAGAAMMYARQRRKG